MLCFVWTWSFQGQPGINGRPGIEGLEVIRHAHIYVSHMTTSAVYSFCNFIDSNRSKKKCSYAPGSTSGILCILHTILH